MNSGHKAVLLGAVVILGTAAFGAVSTEKFTREVLAKIQAAIPTHQYAYQAPLEIAEVIDGKPTGQMIYLDRVYFYVRDNPLDADRVVSHFVSQIAQVVHDSDKPVSPESILLAVRNAELIANGLKEMPPDSQAAFPRLLAGDLMVLPVVDSTSSVQYLNGETLQKMSIDEAAAVELGMANLRKLQQPLMSVAKIPPKSGFGTINEEYAASRLIAVSDWKELAAAMGGNLVVMAPAYDTLIYGDGSTDVGVDALRTFGKQVALRSEVPLSRTILRFAGDHWEVVE